MPREPQQPTIGQAELQILNYIADRHPITVRQVAEYFAQTKGHVRTTVLNVMSRLCDKGYLTRQKSNGVFEYSPRVPRPQLLRSLVGQFVQRTLGGSISPFMAYLAEDARVSEAELQQLKRIVEQLDRTGGGR